MHGQHGAKRAVYGGSGGYSGEPRLVLRAAALPVAAPVQGFSPATGALGAGNASSMQVPRKMGTAAAVGAQQSAAGRPLAGAGKQLTAGAAPAAGVQLGAAAAPQSRPVPRQDMLGHWLRLPLRLVVSALLLGLLVEWLLPIRQMPDWNGSISLYSLLAAAGAFLFIGALLLPGWASLLLRAGIVLAGGVWMAGGGNIFSRAAMLPAILAQDGLTLARADFGGLSSAGQALCLLTGLAAFLSALQTLVWIRQWGLGLTLLTGIYLAALYEWMGMDLFFNMARTATEGLLLCALLTGHRLRRRLGESATGRAMTAGTRGRVRGSMPKLRWWLASAAAAGIVLGAGMLMASGKPRLAQPAPWALEAQKSMREGIASRAAAQTAGTSQHVVGTGTLKGAFSGYSKDDSVLGAPLALTRTPVFTAISPEPLYWRGESKSVYDGRGWREDVQQLLSLQIGSGDTGESAESASEQMIRQTVNLPLYTEGQSLPASGREAQLLKVQTESGRPASSAYLKDTGTGAVYLSQGSGGAVQYTVQSVVPESSPEILRKRAGAPSSAPDGESSQELDRNLQLPATLPQRVRDLAAKIVSGAGSNRYDQVVAVRDYLKSHYVYSLTNTRIPADNEDLTDQFLFVQKSGYCVHFSTAMTVMLRSQGIPTRWVKGYTAGTPLPESESAGKGVLEMSGGDGGHLYQVTAADAHAWVEVYLEGSGWVAFDPTPGFAGPDGGASAASAAGSQAAAPSPRPAAPAYGALPERLRAAARDAAEHAGTAAQASAAAAGRLARTAAQPGPLAAAAVLAAAAAALASPALRGRLRLALALRRYARACAAGAAVGRRHGGPPPAERAGELRSRHRSRRRGAPRAALLAVAAELGAALERRRSAQLAPAAAEAQRRLAVWAEAARFGPPAAAWGGPAPRELAAVAALLLARPAAGSTGSAASSGSS